MHMGCLWCLVDTNLSRTFLEQLVLVGNLSPTKIMLELMDTNSCTNRNRYKFDQHEVFSIMIHTGFHRIPLRNASTKALKPRKQNGINGLWPRWLDVQLYSLGCVDSL